MGLSYLAFLQKVTDGLVDNELFVFLEGSGWDISSVKNGETTSSDETNPSEAEGSKSVVSFWSSPPLPSQVSESHSLPTVPLV